MIVVSRKRFCLVLWAELASSMEHFYFKEQLTSYSYQNLVFCRYFLENEWSKHVIWRKNCQYLFPMIKFELQAKIRILKSLYLSWWIWQSFQIFEDFLMRSVVILTNVIVFWISIMKYLSAFGGFYKSMNQYMTNAWCYKIVRGLKDPFKV